MNRFIIVSSFLLLMIVGCARTPQATQFDLLTENDVIAAYNTATQAYSWFDLTTMPLDTSDCRNNEDGTYNRVEVAGIISMAELEDYLNTLFHPELTESLLAIAPHHYRDFDGVLYGQCADRGSNLYLQDKYVQAVRKDDTHWTVILTFYAGFADNIDSVSSEVTIGYSQSILNYEKTDAGWRFTSFCPTDNLNLEADTVYTFTYNADTFDNTDFNTYSDFQLCCYLLNADGFFAEWPSDLLIHRFLKNPQNIIDALCVIANSPWENKNNIAPLVGCSAASWFTEEERIAFEEILNSNGAVWSDAERAVLDAIADAYKTSMAEQAANRVMPSKAYSFT